MNQFTALSQAHQEWQESTPEAQGVNSSQLAQILKYVEHEHKGLNSLLIIRHGYLILEVYYPPYTKETNHNLNSVTKSVVSALVGIAIEKGFITSDANRVGAWFPELSESSNDSLKASIEISQLLSMSSGLSWPQYGRENVSDQMDRSPDWIRFILSRPMAARPGTESNYSNGDAHLLSALVQRATRQPAAEFAWTTLFEPLGIQRPRWERDPQGINIGSAALFLTPRDMAKLGYLYLNDGVWNGTQIVPAAWVQKSLVAHTQIRISPGLADYGYYWWLYPQTGMVEAWGFGGQRIAVFRDLDLVTVMTGDIPDDQPVTPFSKEIYRQILKAMQSQSGFEPTQPDPSYRLSVFLTLAVVSWLTFLFIRRKRGHLRTNRRELPRIE
jgi:CubicO group peptidase (beta-lactamase class C family)